MFYVFFYICVNISKTNYNTVNDKMDNKERPKCSYCNSDKVIPIVYGYPTSKDFQEYERGEIKLGGCISSGLKPNWHCNNCDRSF